MVVSHPPMLISHRRLSSAGLAILLGASMLTGCDDQTAQVAALSESFQKRLEDKEKELGSLRSQVGEARGQLTALQAEVDAARSRPPVDASALAKELAPLLSAGRTETVRREDPAAVAGEFKLPEPVTRPSKPGDPANRGRTSSEVRGSGGSGGDAGRRKIEMDWGPVSR